MDTKNSTLAAPYSTLAAPSGELSKLLNELDSATMSLQDTTATLGEGLRPVLRNEPSGVTETQPQLEANTEVGQALANILRRVQATNVQLREVYSKLEL